MRSLLEASNVSVGINLTTVAMGTYLNETNLLVSFHIFRFTSVVFVSVLLWLFFTTVQKILQCESQEPPCDGHEQNISWREGYKKANPLIIYLIIYKYDKLYCYVAWCKNSKTYVRVYRLSICTSSEREISWQPWQGADLHRLLISCIYVSK